jgi:hypothetical protein
MKGIPRILYLHYWKYQDKNGKTYEHRKVLMSKLKPRAPHKSYMGDWYTLLDYQKIPFFQTAEDANYAR